MSSSWGKKLGKKLNGLADTASKESIQTLSNWIAFNRKHAQTTAKFVTDELKNLKQNTKRQWLYWQLIHEILVRETGNATKWEKLAELRLALGEGIQPAMKALGNSMPEQLGACLEEWEDRDVFGGLSMNAQIRNLYQNRKNLATTRTEAAPAKKTPTTAPAASSTTENPVAGITVKQEDSSDSVKDAASSASSGVAGDASVAVEKEATVNSEPSANDEDTEYPVPDSKNDDDDVDVEPEPPQQTEQHLESQSESKENSSEEVPEKPPPLKRNTSLSQPVEYDFENKGIPPGDVESRDFLDPCKAITTLQIARDIRTNTAVEISTALANLPADVLATCRDLDSGTLEELDAAAINDFSVRIPSSLIDLDINEETSSLNLFEDIVKRQQKAREKLIYLLIKSRCKFGSTEAARDFYATNDIMVQLNKRKELLSDALELEGLDTTKISLGVSVSDSKKTNAKGKGKKRKKGKENDNEGILTPLTWYVPEVKTECTNKKQKLP